MNAPAIVLGVPSSATTRRLCLVSVCARAVKLGLSSIWSLRDSPEASQVIVVSRNDNSNRHRQIR